MSLQGHWSNFTFFLFFFFCLLRYEILKMIPFICMIHRYIPVFFSYHSSLLSTMHLSECVDLFSESNYLDHEVRECVNKWFWKTQTQFYNNEDLVLNPSFGALCWSYSLAGITMFAIESKSKWAQQSNFPYVPYALLLTFVQGTCKEVGIGSTRNSFDY